MYSPLPLVNYLIWISVRSFVEPRGEESGAAVSCAGTDWRADTASTWRRNPAERLVKTGTWFVWLSLSTLVGVLYAPVLGSLVRQWWTDPNYGHGFFVVGFVGYVLWITHDRWRALQLRPSNLGFVVMLLAIALRVLGVLGAELFLGRVSLVTLISGMVLFLAGRQALRSIAFPIGYLLFMIPLPTIVYYQLTLPLQLWASRLGASGLVAIGIRTVREGNLLLLPNCTLNVVEACSGIRSLLSLLAAVVAYGYLAESSMWKRLLLAASSIPIAIATNGLRLVATGSLSYFFGPRVDSGAVHLVLGVAFFLLAFLLVLLVHKLIGLGSRYQHRVLVAQ